MAEATGESIATCLRLSKSLGLARQGRLREAQQLLAAEGTLPESSLELHALAALATGDGDYSRALRLWRLLLQREPGHAEAKRMIDSIELWLSRPAWCSYLPIGLVVASVGLLIILFFAVFGGEPPPPPQSRPPQQAAPRYEPAARSSAPPPSVSFPASRPSETRRTKSR